MQTIGPELHESVEEVKEHGRKWLVCNACGAQWDIHGEEIAEGDGSCLDRLSSPYADASGAAGRQGRAAGKHNVKRYAETSYHVTVYEEIMQPWEEGDDEPETETTVHHEEDYDSLGAALSAVSDNSWLEWSSTHPADGDWLTTEGQQNYRSGETTTYSLFVKRNDGKRLTKEEIAKIDTLRTGRSRTRYQGGDVTRVQRSKKGLSPGEEWTPENPSRPGQIPMKRTAFTRRQLRLPGLTRGRG